MGTMAASYGEKKKRGRYGKGRKKIQFIQMKNRRLLGVKRRAWPPARRKGVGREGGRVKKAEEKESAPDRFKNSEDVTCRSWRKSGKKEKIVPSRKNKESPLIANEGALIFPI